MAVIIRLSRIGKKHVPFFRIVAVDRRKKVGGACLENLGTYNALSKTLIQFNAEGIAEWEKKGAILSDTVKKLRKLHEDIAAGKAKPEKKKKPSKKAKVKAAAPKEEPKVEAAPAPAEEPAKEAAPATEKVKAEEAAPAEETKKAAPEAPAQEAKAEEKPAEEPKADAPAEGETKE